MPRSWFDRRRSRRGASAPEYAIGAAVLAVVLLGATQAFEAAADQRYDDEQAVVGTPVTDLGGAPSTTAGATSTTATIPPAVTTTSAPAATTTTTVLATTTTAPRTIALSAQGVAGSGTNWSISFSVTSNAPAGTTVTVTASGSGKVGTCVLAGGACSGSITGLKGSDGTQSVQATAQGANPSNTVSVPVA